MQAADNYASVIPTGQGWVAPNQYFPPPTPPAYQPYPDWGRIVWVPVYVPYPQPRTFH